VGTARRIEQRGLVSKNEEHVLALAMGENPSLGSFRLAKRSHSLGAQRVFTPSRSFDCACAVEKSICMYMYVHEDGDGDNQRNDI